MRLQQVRAAFVPLALFLSCQGLANGEPVRWVNPDHLNDAPYIVKQLREDVLINRWGDPATVAIYSTTQSYADTVKHLRIAVGDRHGIAASRSLVASFAELNDYSTEEVPNDVALSMWNASWKESVARLREMGFSTDQLSYTEIFSRPYNLLGKRKAESTLHIRILDCQELFGANGSMIVVYRRDRANEWGWSNRHNPFSFGYAHHVSRVVTKTDHDLISASLPGGYEYMISPLGSNPLPSYADDWDAARRWVRAKGSSEGRAR